MALGMQTGFSLKELGASMITAGIGGGMAAKFPTLSNTPLLQRLLKNGVTVLTAQLAEVSLNLRHDIDPRAIAAQMLGATMGEDISAQFGDSVADQATAAALSTASSAVLGSAITHTPLDAENLAETMLGTAIGTSIGAKFAPKPGEDLLGNKHTTKHVPSLTKQAQTQQKQQRSATAAEKKHDDLHQPHKPKGPKHKLYDPSNDPIIQQAEAVANMSLPKADLAHFDYHNLQGDYTSSHIKQWRKQGFGSGIKARLADEKISFINLAKAWQHPYDNLIAPMLDNLMPANVWEAASVITGGPALLAANYVERSVSQSLSTMAKQDFRGLAFGSAYDRGYAVTDIGINLAESMIGDGAAKVALLSKVGLFSAAAKSATLLKTVRAVKPFSTLGMFAGKVENAKILNIAASSPSEIAWGYGKLSSRQLKLLKSLPKPGRSTQIYKSNVSLTDLAALTAHTGDEFAIFTLGSRRIVVRGTASGLKIQNELSDKLLSQGWRWSAHTHPGLSDNFLMASGFPGDRQALQIFKQERSLILNSAGRRSIFDIQNDYAITNESSYESTFRLGEF